MKKQKINPAFKVTIAVVIVLGFGFTSGYALIKLFTTSPYFRIKDIVTTQERNITLSYLVGHNIFSVDLAEQARILTEMYPIYKKVRLVRLLPNRLYVDFVLRRPVAYIRLYRIFSVDEDGVLFDVGQTPSALDLPLVVGLETKMFGPKAGKKFKTQELFLALDIIREVQANRLLRYWKIKKIDVAAPANASCTLEVPVRTPHAARGLAYTGTEPLEVKIGPDNIKAKIQVFASLLIQLKNDWLTIKYMDLRFKEPVIKFKDAHAKK